MLAKQQRLTRAEFGNVLAHGRRLFGNQVTLVYAQNSVESARFGVSVSKKVARRAVDRHYLRRVVYDVLRAQKNLDQVSLVVIVKPGFGTSPFPEIKKAVTGLLERITVS